MSQQEVQAIVNRARTSPEFATALLRDFTGALRSDGYTLSEEETQTVRSMLSGNSGGQPTPGLPLSDAYETFHLQQEQGRKRLVAQTDRMVSLNNFTADVLKDTISHSASTYRKITLMNQVMFWMGVGLFLFAVAYAVVTKNLQSSVAFAGLGAVSFIGFFFLTPIRQTQTALSNLISAEIAFMNFFEQMSLLEGLAGSPRTDGTGLPDPARIERATELMQQRSLQTVDMLHRYSEQGSASSQPAVDGDGSNTPLGDPPSPERPVGDKPLERG